MGAGLCVPVQHVDRLRVLVSRAALGGIAGVGQLQLLQPFFGFLLAAWLLHEAVPASMLVVTAVVVACVAGARRFAGAPAARPAR